MKEYVIINCEGKRFYLYNVLEFSNIKNSYQLSLNIDYCDLVVMNKYNKMITTVEDNSYVLIKEKNHKSIQNLIFSFYPKKSISFNWRILWMKKLDYIEEYYPVIRGQYHLIDESISYYIGLLELSIFLLNDFDNCYGIGYIQHVVMDEELYYNPLNLVIDFKERDFAEYLKYIFFSGKSQNIDIKKLILEGKDLFQFDLVIARLIMPNYYFQQMDKVIMKKIDEKSLKTIIQKNEEYLKYVKQIIDEIKLIYPIKKYPIL